MITTGDLSSIFWIWNQKFKQSVFLRPNYEKRNICYLIYLFAVRTKLSDCQKIFSCSSYLVKTFDPAVARYKDRHHTSRKLGVSALQNRSGAVLSGGNQSDTKEMYCKRCYVLQSSHKWRLARSSANGSHLQRKTPYSLEVWSIKDLHVVLLSELGVHRRSEGDLGIRTRSGDQFTDQTPTIERWSCPMLPIPTLERTRMSQWNSLNIKSLHIYFCWNFPKVLLKLSSYG